MNVSMTNVLNRFAANGIAANVIRCHEAPKPGCAEVLKYSGLSNFSEPRWQYVGYAKLQGEDLNYFNIPGLRIAGNQGVLIIAVCQVSPPRLSSVQLSAAGEGRLPGQDLLDAPGKHQGAPFHCQIKANLAFTQQAKGMTPPPWQVLEKNSFASQRQTHCKGRPTAQRIRCRGGTGVRGQTIEKMHKTYVYEIEGTISAEATAGLADVWAGVCKIAWC